MRDPTRRAHGSWPRDRPVRWGRVAGNLSWFVIGSAAAILQLVLVVPILAFGGSASGADGRGAARVVLALVWAGLTLFAAWSWIFGRWRVVLAPVLTVLALYVASAIPRA
jgi:hypothetical protein